MAVFRARVAQHPADPLAWVPEGLGDHPRVLRVVDHGQGEALDPVDRLDVADAAAGHRLYDVFYSAPDWALCAVAGDGFVHPDDRPSVCPVCGAPVPPEDLHPASCESFWPG